MRFLFRWAFRLFLVVIVLAVALLLLKDLLLKTFAESQIRARTGMDARIGKLEVQLLSPTVIVEDLKIFNRAEFGGLPFLDAPDLYIEYNPSALSFGTLRLKLVRLTLADVHVVESREGQTNVSFSLDSVTSAQASAHTEPPSFYGLRFAGIDTLNLTAGKIVYSSLRRPGERTEVNLGLKDAVITNVKTLGELQDVLARTALRNGITIDSRSLDVPRSKPDRSTSAPPGAKPNRKSSPGSSP
jgi:uncharacterized protein involved in outer membrane biogenesis